MVLTGQESVNGEYHLILFQHRLYQITRLASGKVHQCGLAFGMDNQIDRFLFRAVFGSVENGWYLIPCARTAQNVACGGEFIALGASYALTGHDLRADILWMFYVEHIGQRRAHYLTEFSEASLIPRPETFQCTFRLCDDGLDDAVLIQSIIRSWVLIVEDSQSFNGLHRHFGLAQFFSFLNTMAAKMYKSVDWTKLRTYLAAYLVLSIGSGMTLSRRDISTASSGLGVILLVLFGMNLLLAVFGIAAPDAAPLLPWAASGCLILLLVLFFCTLAVLVLRLLLTLTGR